MADITSPLQIAMDAGHSAIQQALAPITGQPADARTRLAVISTLRSIEKSIARDRAALDATLSGLRFYVAFPHDQYVDAGDLEMTVHGTGMSKEDAIRHAEGSHPDVEFRASRCTWRLYDYIDRHGIDDDFRWGLTDTGLVDIEEDL
ncbi:MAG: hypothetical protein KJ944_08550 [Alphaproteobacteria bacterium]|nr:hypothetical protein [Alphaproteobacteria bacterium]MBU2302632.1 hypothetical protein [Alphaproteobacteria bacterium]